MNISDMLLSDNLEDFNLGVEILSAQDDNVLSTLKEFYIQSDYTVYCKPDSSIVRKPKVHNGDCIFFNGKEYVIRSIHLDDAFVCDEVTHGFNYGVFYQTVIYGYEDYFLMISIHRKFKMCTNEAGMKMINDKIEELCKTN